MRSNSALFHQNPLSDLLPDETFHLLIEHGLVNERALRNFVIRQKYKTLRANKVKAIKAIDLLQKEYDNLKYDTIRKIVYNIRS